MSNKSAIMKKNIEGMIIMGFFSDFVGYVGGSILDDVADVFAEDLSNDELCDKINADSLMSDCYVKELEVRLRANDIEDLITDYLECVNCRYSAKILNTYLKIITNKVNKLGIKQRKYLRKEYGNCDERLYDILFWNNIFTWLTILLFSYELKKAVLIIEQHCFFY